MENDLELTISACATLISNCKALIITAGAGMGVDSGMPDFRSSKGWWRKRSYDKISFISLASAENFINRPEMAWGFYGYRLNMYRATQPHMGFGLIFNWVKRYNLDYFVATSNIDGHFQKAGFAERRIYECHGSLHYLQCSSSHCLDAVWENTEEFTITPDLLTKNIPHCPYCGQVARPNVLMFTDNHWIADKYRLRRQKLERFFASHQDEKHSIVILEIGAGTAIPTIRDLTMSFTVTPYATAIRINPHEPQIPIPHISLPIKGLEALQQIEQTLLAPKRYFCE